MPSAPAIGATSFSLVLKLPLANSNRRLSYVGSLQTAVTLLRKRDGRACLRAVQDRMPAWLLRRGVAHVYELPLPLVNGPASIAAELPAGFEFREACAAELQADPDFTAADNREYARRFAAGERCFGVFAGRELTHFSWLHRGPVYVRGPGLLLDRLAPHDGYLYDVLTKPRYRGRGLYAATQRKLMELLIADQTPRVLQVVERGNEAPLRLLPRLGYVHSATVQSSTTFGYKRSVITSAATKATVHRLHWRRPQHVFCI